jgi:hypothetical protein
MKQDHIPIDEYLFERKYVTVHHKIKDDIRHKTALSIPPNPFRQ